MSTGRDDEALSWEGDDDPTLVHGANQPPAAAPGGGRPGRETGAEPVPSGRDTDDDVSEEASAAQPAALGNAGLIALGVIGGVYVIIALGWLIGGMRLHGVAGFLVAADGQGEPTWSAGNLVAVWFATLSPVIWFATVWLLTRRAAPWLRWVLLVAGVLLLLPWPFIMVGAVGT